MNLLNSMFKFLTGFGILGIGLGGGGDSAVADIKMPEWYEDPLYQSTQDYLNTYGTNILEGKLPSFYSGLGTTNSKEFQDMLAMTNRDTAKAVNENLVRRGISRGGVGLSTIAKATADTGTTLRWSDFQRAMNEKAGLLNTGLNTLSGVRSAALSKTGLKNNFNLGVTGLQLNQANQIDAANSQEDSMWGSLLSSGISAAALIASSGLAAPTVAGGEIGSGLTLGSAATGMSGFDWAAPAAFAL